jgi:hypothetical protein
MHGLCIDCHKERAAELERPHHGDCATCHHQAVASDGQVLTDRRRRHEAAVGTGG